MAWAWSGRTKNDIRSSTSERYFGVVLARLWWLDRNFVYE